MKVKEVLRLAVANLGNEELERAVANSVEQPTGELASLLRCYNLVENEIALDYFPLKTQQTFVVENGAILFSAFSYAPVSVTKAIMGKNAVEYELCADRVRVHGAPSGASVTLFYSYSPSQKEWADSTEFNGKISARLLSYGVTSEYCLSCGRFSEAATWEKKYRDALKAANIIRKKLCIRARRWL